MFQHNVLSVMPHHLVGPPGSSLNTQDLDNNNSMVVFPIPEFNVLVNNRVFFWYNSFIYIDIVARMFVVGEGYIKSISRSWMF